MSKSKKILIVSGEPSGDLHASNLVKELLSINPKLKFFGIGGSLSKKAGVDIVFDISKLALIGVIEVLKNISIVRRAYKALLERMDSERPDLAILVDYPGFNLRLARELKKRSVPTVYYISPQVWAWGMDRIGIIKKCVKKIIVFFKFEEGLYKRNGVDVEFVGHPLLDTVKTSLSREAVLKGHGMTAKATTIALLPGSRAMEVKTLLPIMAASCKIIARKMPDVQFIVSKFKDLPMDMYKDITKKESDLDLKLAEGDTYNILGASDFAIVASGTAVLETTIIGTPFILTYKVNPLSYIIINLFRRTKSIGLVNIIAGKVIVPELLQFDATPERIADTVMTLLSDRARLSLMRDSLKYVTYSLGAPGASRRAAGAILPLLQTVTP